MTALEKATRFVRKSATKTALVIVPLAMASSANAASITFNVAGATAVADLGGSPGTFSALGVGGIHFDNDYAFFDASGSGFTFLTLTLSGTGSGLLDVPAIPAAYDFSFGPTLTGFSSSVTYSINGIQRGAAIGLGPTAAGSVSLAGWAPTDNLTTWGVVLRADFDPTKPLTLSVRHIDIGPAQTDATVPEPASLLMLATGLGLFGVRRRRLRQSST